MDNFWSSGNFLIIMHPFVFVETEKNMRVRAVAPKCNLVQIQLVAWSLHAQQYSCFAVVSAQQALDNKEQGCCARVKFLQNTDSNEMKMMKNSIFCFYSH